MQTPVVRTFNSWNVYPLRPRLGSDVAPRPTRPSGSLCVARSPRPPLGRVGKHSTGWVGLLGGANHETLPRVFPPDVCDFFAEFLRF